MKIIIIGGGKVGTALCRSLVKEDHDVILIEKDEEVLKRVSKRYDIMGIVGNGANHLILNEAGVDGCDIFVATSEHDEVNMVAGMLAKRMGAKETVVRVRNPEYTNPYFKEQNLLGISLIVNPELLSAQAIANTVEFPNSLSVEYFGNGRIMVMEFMIRTDSPLANRSIIDFRKNFSQILICAIERDKQILIPDGESKILPGDRIFVTGQRNEIVKFHNKIKKKAAKNLMIIGAGKIAYYLLKILLNSHIKIKLLEINRSRADFFAQEFPNLNIVVGDGTAKDVLLEEGAANFDAVATLTGVDEENIIATLFMEKLGVEKNIAKVNRTSLLEIISKDGISTIITPKAIAVDHILHFIRGRVNAQDSNLEALHHIANGQIETLQFVVTEKNPILNRKLSSIQFEKDVLVAAIIRQGQVILPSGDDALQINDRVLVFSRKNNVASFKALVKG